ncbi:uncharacterized protein J3D65DRAFT_610049 [Phyllosticta citribraziliensis]|uniref:Uncharacterized protein n=1 Tax=Phyllosticta citribraziliensis TaxID=989973 RepID=A0ABR1MBB0_9PEZI
MRPLSPKMVLLLGALLLLAMAPLCVVADAINGTIEHYKDQDPYGVLIQLPPPVDQVVKNLETIPIVSVHRKKPHGIAENLAPHESLVSHRSPVLAKGPHPSFTPHTLIRAKRAVETPDQSVPQTALPDIAPSSSTLPLDAPVLSRHVREELLWPRQLVWDPTLIQKPSSSAVPLSGDRLVRATLAASIPSEGTARVEKRDVNLSGSQYGGTLRPQAFSSSKGGPPSSSTRRAGGATEHLKPYMNRVFPQLPHSHSTRTWSTRTASVAATSKLPHRHGFHDHQQLPFRPSPSSSSSPSPSRPSSRRPVLNTTRPAAADAAKKEKGTAGQWVAIGICAFLVLAIFLYLLIRGVSCEIKDGQRRRSAANGSGNNNGGDGHALQSIRTSRPASDTANTNAAVPDDAKLPSTFINPLRQNPPTPPRASWQWGGMRSVGQVEEDRVDNPYTYPSAPRVEEDRNPYTYHLASDHAPAAYPSLSRAKSATDATSKVPTTSSGRLPLPTLSNLAPVAGGSVTRSSSSASSSTLFDSSKDAHVRDMLASRNKKNRESWEIWNKRCCQNEKERDGVEEQKGV